MGNVNDNPLSGLNILYFITHWKWIEQGKMRQSSFQTYNTCARTFTHTTMREEMKIVLYFT